MARIAEGYVVVDTTAEDDPEALTSDLEALGPQAADQVKALGVSYFGAAGNRARTSYESPFRPSGMSFNIGLGMEEAHDFDPGPGVDTCQQITLPGAGQTSVVSFQWDQPFASATVGGPRPPG